MYNPSTQLGFSRGLLGALIALPACGVLHRQRPIPRPAKERLEARAGGGSGRRGRRERHGGPERPGLRGGLRLALHWRLRELQAVAQCPAVRILHRGRASTPGRVHQLERRRPKGLLRGRGHPLRSVVSGSAGWVHSDHARRGDGWSGPVRVQYSLCVYPYNIIVASAPILVRYRRLQNLASLAHSVLNWK